MTRITAALARAHGAPMTLEELELRAPRDGEIEVTMEAVAVCHSDIGYWEGGFGGAVPAVYGHEAAGRVSALGPGVEGLEIGQRVVVTLIRACGACATCGSGRPTLCRTPRRHPGPLTLPDGGEVNAEMDCGAFAERVVVERGQCVAVPDALGPAEACLLGCGVITGVASAVHAGGLRAGEDVVVIGAGGVGLNAIQGARIAGARRIVAVDLSEARLEDARLFGATDVVLASAAKPWRAALRAMGRGADLCLVCAGAVAAYEDAMRYLAWGGRMVMVGMPHSGQMARYEPVVAAFTGQHMLGAKLGDAVIQRDIPWMADLYLQGRLKLSELVSRSWSLAEINEAFADTKAGGARRNVILF
ncbi:alcohol dehydrogenase catalytic domain-containing protein [Litorisediminicola beolgyonensis]|uniref:Alcohol dehydrogenase catalytic domain-containing protein n=1 Tax=Litorisediminicola beolgyonensis TaxID=1173614 RepID=A0ABW3ZGU9_9RHOB